MVGKMTAARDEIVTINRRLSDASLKALSLGTQAIMERMADLEAALKQIADMPSENDEWDAVDRFAECRQIAQAVFTAAPAAGEQSSRYSQYDPSQEAKWYREAIAATIERCAQVAERYFEAEGHIIAAEIRALMDRP